MTHLQLEASATDTLRAYWRSRAALAIYMEYSTLSDLGIKTLNYANVPQHGVAVGFLKNETVTSATAEIIKYADERLAGDLFLALISHFESFLGAALARASKSTTGTLGELQRRIEQTHILPVNLIEEFDEVRRRRNCLIHHHGVADADYKTAAAKVHAGSGGWVPDPATITSVDVPPGYLSYVVDVIVRYSRAVP